ncbi:adhesion G protein-coupled receptor E1 isoform X2 [Cricetulus griseus]|uniref:Adhesion G protein-coupled receptor E1 isoform X2 n=1 Tax=Cricetulus griseus TaxID=10029 RepID=A0A9J7H169_CRIGR|nr:adhesion G protein-coupled receptor E1 isoform X2 [Cricetulus griseus]
MVSDNLTAVHAFPPSLFTGCSGVHRWGMTTLPTLGQSLKGVNECEDTTTCPAYATCTDTIDSYYCTCKRGFKSSNGQTNFKGPGVVCEDIDECLQSSSPCGPNSVCKNLLGRAQCSCLSGYSPPMGQSWILGSSDHFLCTDIDECLTIGICPSYSNCTNTIGSYNCTCQPGFIWHNLVCEDDDECVKHNACPEHAACHNTLGSYHCTCDSGHESSGGRSMFQGLEESCEDVDECSRNSTLCGPTLICINTQGSYNCSCPSGFSLSTSQVPGHQADKKCIDIDECDAICPSNSLCTNTPGSYFCTCHPGFALSNGQVNFTDPEVACEDIDECIQDPSPCGRNSVCTNVPGSYICGCLPNFRPEPEGSQAHGNFSCKRIPFKCKEDLIPNSEQIQQCQAGNARDFDSASFCTLVNATFSILDNTCANKSAPVSLQNAARSISQVLERAPQWAELSREETSALGTILLETVESAMLATLLTPSVNVSQTIETENLDIESKVINEDCNEENMPFNLKARGDSMTVGCSIIKESESTGTPGVAFVSFAHMASVLDERFFEDGLASWKLKMNSRVVGGIMTGEKKEGFSKTVVYTLQHIQPKQKSERPICVSWNPNVDDGRWTRSGCKITKASETYTECSCNRMANLAIIMASGEITMEFSLYIISHVGTVISLVCLALAIATFLLCRAVHNQNTYMHLHLCVCLFLAKFLFLVGVDKTDNQTACAIIAGFLHYLFLACFFWMLVEAVMLFLTVRNLKVVNYFSSRNIKMLHLCAFGYGLPVLVVVISASIQPQGYGTHNLCWLNTKTGFIWSFLGPVCGIITINSILLTWTLWVLKQKLCSVSSDVSKLKDTRLLTFKAIAQIFILGCSWVLGIFQIGPMASIMAYLFTIINSLQGAFIFLIHCLLNRQVRGAYREVIIRKTESSSHSQTSGILLTSMQSNSKMITGLLDSAYNIGPNSAGEHPATTFTVTVDPLRRQSLLAYFLRVVPSVATCSLGAESLFRPRVYRAKAPRYPPGLTSIRRGAFTGF